MPYDCVIYENSATHGHEAQRLELELYESNTNFVISAELGEHDVIEFAEKWRPKEAVTPSGDRKGSLFLGALALQLVVSTEILSSHI